jgi:hypothetical protein
MQEGHLNSNLNDPEDRIIADNINLHKFMPFDPPGYKVDKKEYLRAVLLYVGDKCSLLPELLEVFSLEDTLLFLHIFSGQKIAVPKRKQIEAGLKDIAVYFAVVNNSSAEEITRLAKLNSVTTQTIKLIVERIAAVLNQPNPLKKQE